MCTPVTAIPTHSYNYQKIPLQQPQILGNTTRCPDLPLLGGREEPRQDRLIIDMPCNVLQGKGIVLIHYSSQLTLTHKMDARMWRM